VIFDVPRDTPPIIPDDDPIVATEVLPLVHKPPPTASLSVLLLPLHTSRLPRIGPGSGLTVMVVETAQPPGIV
jgi:hypothetical protein